MDVITAVVAALWTAFALNNPSFEPPYVQVSPSCQWPPGWEIVQWEGDPKGVETGPIYDPYWYRRSDGLASLKIINPFAPMHVWVAQRVYLPPQTRLRFEVDVHGWYVAEGDPEWDGDVPLSSDPVSQACAFVSPQPPPFAPECPLQVVNDPPFRRLIAEGEGEGWWWVGVYLASPAGRNNDFYVDNAAAFAASLPVLARAEERAGTPVGQERWDGRVATPKAPETPSPTPSHFDVLAATPTPLALTTPSPTPQKVGGGEMLPATMKSVPVTLGDAPPGVADSLCTGGVVVALGAVIVIVALVALRAAHFC